MSTIHCPLCGKEIDPDATPTRPFCTLRCRQIDLKRWLGEEYGLVDETEEEEPTEFDDFEA